MCVIKHYRASFPRLDRCDRVAPGRPYRSLVREKRKSVVSRLDVSCLRILRISTRQSFGAARDL